MFERLLTTIDNPYNPFTQYSDWYAYDSNFYNSCAVLGAKANTANGLTDEMNDYEIEKAMNKIIKDQLFGVHILVDKKEAEKVTEFARNHKDYKLDQWIPIATRFNLDRELPKSDK